MSFKIKINIPAMNRFADSIRRVGEAADKIGNAVKPVAEIADNPRWRSARRALRNAGDAAWARIIGHGPR